LVPATVCLQDALAVCMLPPVERLQPPNGSPPAQDQGAGSSSPCAPPVHAMLEAAWAWQQAVQQLVGSSSDPSEVLGALAGEGEGAQPAWARLEAAGQGLDAALQELRLQLRHASVAGGPLLDLAVRMC
jgi:hypothetical protein